jgi:hypothetical protein
MVPKGDGFVKRLHFATEADAKSLGGFRSFDGQWALHDAEIELWIVIDAERRRA